MQVGQKDNHGEGDRKTEKNIAQGFILPKNQSH
jgi:hypothetical protein